MPLVYISASVSRAYRTDARSGEFSLYRTGPPMASLAVRYTVNRESAPSQPAGDRYRSP